MFEDRSGTGATGKFRETEGGEGQVSVGAGMAGNTGSRSIDNSLYKLEKKPLVEMRSRLTLLWSIISAMTATLPAWGPDRRRTTEKKNHNFRYLPDAAREDAPRPTSTNRLKFDSDWK